MDELTPEQIANWKTKYGAVYQMGMRNRSFVMRPLTVGEYLSLQSFSLSSAELEEHLVKLALLHPLDFDIDIQSAGLITTLAEEILQASGFANPQVARDVLESKRNQSNDIYMLMKAIVLSAIPSYKESELDDLTFAKLAEKVVLAEKILEIHLNINNGSAVTLQLVDPEAEKPKKKAGPPAPGQATNDDPIAQRLRTAM